MTARNPRSQAKGPARRGPLATDQATLQAAVAPRRARRRVHSRAEATDAGSRDTGDYPAPEPGRRPVRPSGPLGRQRVAFGDRALKGAQKNAAGPIGRRHRPYWQYRQRVRRNHREAIPTVTKHVLCQFSFSYCNQYVDHIRRRSGAHICPTDAPSAIVARHPRTSSVRLCTRLSGPGESRLIGVSDARFPPHAKGRGKLFTASAD